MVLGRRPPSSEGAHVHLVNPSGLAWENRRVKNDYRDCKDLLERLRLHKLPEAWISPPETRELRELVGPTLAAIFVAEIGDVSRFPSADRLCSWAGLTPKHRESDVKAWRGNITKAGSTLIRWAAIEAIAHLRGGPKLQRDYHRIAERRGRNIARVAVARKLLTLVYYGLRDGEIRCLAQAQDAA